jgi:hypothetical protein
MPPIFAPNIPFSPVYCPPVDVTLVPPGGWLRLACVYVQVCACAIECVRAHAYVHACELVRVCLRVCMCRCV